MRIRGIMTVCVLLVCQVLWQGAYSQGVEPHSITAGDMKAICANTKSNPGVQHLRALGWESRSRDVYDNEEYVEWYLDDENRFSGYNTCLMRFFKTSNSASFDKIVYYFREGVLALAYLQSLNQMGIKTDEWSGTHYTAGGWEYTLDDYYAVVAIRVGGSYDENNGYKWSTDDWVFDKINSVFHEKQGYLNVSDESFVCGYTLKNGEQKGEVKVLGKSDKRTYLEYMADNFVPTGYYKEYHTNGTLAAEGNYKNGSPTGTFKYYTSENVLYHEVAYGNGVSETWNDYDGRFVASCATKNNESQWLIVVGNELEGMPDVKNSVIGDYVLSGGICVFSTKNNGYLDGEFRCYVDTIDGKQYGKDRYPSTLDTTKLMLYGRGKAQMGRLVDTCTSYHLNGNLHQRVCYGSTIKVKEYEEDGTLATSYSVLSNGKPTDTCTMYYRDGKVRQRICYGDIVSIQEFTEDGTLAASYKTAADGKPTGKQSVWMTRTQDGVDWQPFEISCNYVAGSKQGEYHYQDKKRGVNITGSYEKDRMSGKWEWTEPKRKVEIDYASGKRKLFGENGKLLIDEEINVKSDNAVIQKTLCDTNGAVVFQYKDGVIYDRRHQGMTVSYKLRGSGMVDVSLRMGEDSSLNASFSVGGIGYKALQELSSVYDVAKELDMLWDKKVQFVPSGSYESKGGGISASGQMYYGKKKGKWVYNLSKEKLTVHVVYNEGNVSSMRVYRQDGAWYSGKFTYIDEKTGVKVTMKIDDGEPIEDKTKYESLSTGKKIKEAVSTDFMPVLASAGVWYMPYTDRIVKSSVALEENHGLLPRSSTSVFESVASYIPSIEIPDIRMPVSSVPGLGAVKTSEAKGDDDVIYQEAEQDPEFPGGINAMYKFISENLEYPQLAKENNITGRVFVTFVIERDGAVSNVRVLRDIGGGCGAEAVRVIKAMPRWTPGKQKGKAVRVACNLPINFTLKQE